jgi:hypothetical protein
MIEVEMNGEQFVAAIQHFHDVMRGDVERILVAHALDLQARIQRRTPVLTGRLRNSIHTVPPNSSDRFRYTDNSGKSFNGSLGVSTGPGEVIVGTNVEYAPVIEAGRSRQAPQGMFAVSLKEKTLELERAIMQRVQQLWGPI